MIETSTLPTPLAVVVRRLNVCGPDNSADTFLHASYVAEAALKLLGLGTISGLAVRASDHSFRLEHALVRADGLGSWDAAIRECTSQPLAGFLDRPFTDIVAWLTQRRGGEDEGWFPSVCADLEQVFNLLDLESGLPSRRPTVQHLVSTIVQLRNKTRAHGAAGEDFWRAANPPFSRAIEGFISHCPLFSWRWIHLSVRPNESVRGVWLNGTSPQYARDAETESVKIGRDGIYLWPKTSHGPVPFSALLKVNRECTEFFLPNGSFSTSGVGSFIDYGAGKEKRLDAQAFVRPPVTLPPSETEGLSSLIVQSNTFGNLPDLPSSYVLRPNLERALIERLRDQNHPIVTLHGRGGIGKTSLALKVAHELASDGDPLFDEIAWFSARDVDLRLHGPRSVKQRVATLDDIAATYGRLLGVGRSLESLAQALQEADPTTGRGRLLIFDNFETMADMKSVHEFLDTHTHLPNKVLITSRERAFKADYPIEVRGMERAEGEELMRRVAASLSAEGLLDGKALQRIYDFSEGHPYVMRILVGELAKEGR